MIATLATAAFCLWCLYLGYRLWWQSTEIRRIRDILRQHNEQIGKLRLGGVINAD